MTNQEPEQHEQVSMISGFYEFRMTIQLFHRFYLAFQV